MNIRMDSEVKKQAQYLFAELGMDMTTAVNVFLRQAIRCNGFPFELKLEIPNAETLAAIEEAHQMAKDPSKYKTYDNIEEMMEDLLS